MITNGRCSYCGKEFSKKGIRRHLSSCPERKKQFEGTSKRKGTLHNFFQIRIESEDGYWMHVLLNTEATLELLDDFLRGVWLLSEEYSSFFNIDWRRYYSAYGDWGIIYGKESMRFAIEDLLYVTKKAKYVYADSDEIGLQLEVVKAWEGLPLKDAVYIMARNLPVEYEQLNTPIGDMFRGNKAEVKDIERYQMENYVREELEHVELSELEDAFKKALADFKDKMDNMSDLEIAEMEERQEMQRELKALKVYEPLNGDTLDTLLNRYPKARLQNLCEIYELSQLLPLNSSSLKRELVTRQW